jgi:polyribonucleotide nucleotidyltransferase
LYIFLGAVRVGAIDDEIVINPTRLEQQRSTLNLVLSGCAGKKVGMY